MTMNCTTLARIATLAIAGWMNVGVARGEDLLATLRWHDDSFGLSLRPTLGTTLTEPPGDTRVRFVDGEGTSISLAIRQAQTPIDVSMVKQKALQQISYAYPSHLIVDDPDPPDRLAKRPAGRMYFFIPDKRRGNWVLGHVFILIDPYTVADLELRCRAAAFEDVRLTFEAVAASIQLMDPAELDRIRTQQLDAGQAWIDSIPRAQWRGQLPREQWLRILEGEKDIGYMHIRIERDEQLDLPGLQVKIRTHVAMATKTFNQVREYFESDDQKTEIWSDRVSYRQVTSSRPGLPNQTPTVDRPLHATAETGLRSGQQIHVTVETPTKIQPRQWTKPPIAFLSQVDQQLIGPLLPRKKATLSFYTYTSAAQSLTLMTVRTEPILQGRWRGGYRVTLRPAPILAPQTMVYNAQGQLIQWTTAEGQTLKPATFEQVQKIWKLDP